MLGLIAIPTPTHRFALGALAAFAAVLALMLGLPRVFEWMGLWRERWRHGVCGRCGYSRRGLSGVVCPECGADVNVVGEKICGPHSWRRVVSFCVMWVSSVWLAGQTFSFEIAGYWLRLRHGIKFYSGTMMMAAQRGVLNESLVWFDVVVWGIAALGSVVIVLVMRRGKKVC